MLLDAVAEFVGAAVDAAASAAVAAAAVVGAGIGAAVATAGAAAETVAAAAESAEAAAAAATETVASKKVVVVEGLFAVDAAAVATEQSSGRPTEPLAVEHPGICCEVSQSFPTNTLYTHIHRSRMEFCFARVFI